MPKVCKFYILMFYILKKANRPTFVFNGQLILKRQEFEKIWIQRSFKISEVCEFARFLVKIRQTVDRPTIVFDGLLII